MVSSELVPEPDVPLPELMEPPVPEDIEPVPEPVALDEVPAPDPMEPVVPDELALPEVSPGVLPEVLPGMLPDVDPVSEEDGAGAGTGTGTGVGTGAGTTAGAGAGAGGSLLQPATASAITAAARTDCFIIDFPF